MSLTWPKYLLWPLRLWIKCDNVVYILASFELVSLLKRNFSRQVRILELTNEIDCGAGFELCRVAVPVIYVGIFTGLFHIYKAHFLWYNSNLYIDKSQWMSLHSHRENPIITAQWCQSEARGLHPLSLRWPASQLSNKVKHTWHGVCR